ncbi:MAG: hypothetical protein U0W40_19935 [Acidimicrobiia bacterium]
MRVRVDEAGRDVRAAGVDHTLAVGGEAVAGCRDLGDDAVADAHVGLACRRAGAVDQRAPGDEQVPRHGERT